MIGERCCVSYLEKGTLPETDSDKIFRGNRGKGGWRTLKKKNSLEKASRRYLKNNRERRKCKSER